MDLAPALRDRLEAAAAEEASWPHLMNGIADLLGAEEATLGGGSAWEAPRMVAPRTDPGRIGIYLETYHQQNVIMRQMLRQAPGQVVAVDGFSGIEAFRRSDFYHAWCKPQRFNHAFGLTMRTLGGWTGALVVNTRHEVRAEQMTALQALAPQIERALETSQLVGQIRVANRISLDLLAQAGQAALLLDRHGRIVEQNGLAGMLMESGRLPVRDGRIAADSPALSRLIGQCLLQPDHGGGSMTFGDEMTLRCSPFPGSLGVPEVGRPAAIVIIDDPEQRTRQRMVELRKTYGLTQAEAALAQALMRTGSRKAAAAMRNVSDSTARAQLSSIFDKTGVRRQTDLVKLLLG